MASVRPLPPFLPESEAQFLEHVIQHPTDWYEYCQNAYHYIDRHQLSASDLEDQAVRLNARITDLEANARSAQSENDRSRGVIEFQKSLYAEQSRELLAAEIAKEKALAAAQPAVSTPRSSPPPVLLVETLTDPTPRAPPLIATAPSESSRQSEKLPDPDRFTGERKDLRRFASQIHEKMNVNRDRYPTPQARMAYVSNRLSGNPYNQVLPYISSGVCQLPDYEDILRILERAYGDPNRVNNARTELFRYKQTNKEFSIFLAEFQRLGLEGEMSNESLSVLLEQSVSDELKSMMVHNPPTDRRYHQLCAFLQDLDNRRQYYNPSAARTRTYAATVTPSTRIETRKETVTSVRSPVGTNDPMDLSTQRRRSPNRREAGTCYRCGSKDHFVRQCSLPDNRPESVQRHDIERRRVSEVTRRVGSPTRRPTSPRSPPNGRRSSVLPAPRPIQAYYPPSPTLSNNTFSGNGVGLVEVASRS